MSQQARKEQEGQVVRRLTVGAGAAAVGLAWYFTSAAATAVPVAFGAQPASDAREPAGVEQLDDHVFVRTVHVQAPRGPAGGVQTAGAGAAARATARPAAGGSAAPAAGTAPAPIAQPVAASTPKPAPTPVATTGGSTPPR